MEKEREELKETEEQRKTIKEAENRKEDIKYLYKSLNYLNIWMSNIFFKTVN